MLIIGFKLLTFRNVNIFQLNLHDLPTKDIQYAFHQACIFAYYEHNDLFSLFDGDDDYKDNLCVWCVSAPAWVTSSVCIVYGKHVDGDDLQHVCAAQKRSAVLEQRSELLQNTACHSRERFHAA